MTRVSGTEGYAEEAESLVKQYESITFADVHGAIAHLIPTAPSDVLDIGAGTGRDAAAFAALGHRVVAVEPTDELRIRAASLHPAPEIEWLNDALPDLARLMQRGMSFDVAMLTAVWMHLDRAQRRQAMPKVASLVRPGGVVILSLRHGAVPPGRRMFAVSADETIELAQNAGLEVVLNRYSAEGALKRPGIGWTRLAFARPAAAAL
jgi:2-polyprenyl-3-methyl-5-hydroxy-6-metoxy-1,4-benzoquinol methylase